MKNCRVVFALIGLSVLSFSSSVRLAAQRTVDTSKVIISTEQKIYAPYPAVVNNPLLDILNSDKAGLKPTALYSSDDRIFVGLNYNLLSKNWNPDTAGQRHRFYTHYSINQNAFSLGYEGIYQNLFKQWNLFLNAGYDWIKWTNFYGLGNETLQETNNPDYYRVRSREALISASFQRKIGKQSSLTVAPFFQQVQLINDLGRFLSKGSFANDLNNFKPKNFGGLQAQLQLQNVNDLLLPTKGGLVSVGLAHVINLGQTQAYTNYSAYTRLFLPFLNHFVLSIENGGATLTGEPEFYQMNSIGGNSLRGFRRERYRGETVFYNDNELQYIFDVNANWFRGKMGFLAFGDQGRVWKKGETSNDWHYGYGGGLMLVPFHKLYLSVQYGISNERQGVHVEFRKSL